MKVVKPGPFGALLIDRGAYDISKKQDQQAVRERVQ
jgi:hypothetical protein